MADEPRGRAADAERPRTGRFPASARIGALLIRLRLRGQKVAPGARADDVPDRLRDLVLVSGRVDHGAALAAPSRAIRRKRVRSVSWNASPSPSKRSGAALPASALGGARASPVPPASRGSRSGRAASPIHDDVLQTRDELGVELARRALIGAGRIGETVADDPVAARQSAARSSRRDGRCARRKTAAPRRPGRTGAASPDRMTSRKASASRRTAGLARRRRRSRRALSGGAPSRAPARICRRPRRPRT